MKNTYKHSPLFNDIKDVKLQTWNRCAIAFNLAADEGPAASRNYLNQFSEVDKKKILGMFDTIGKFGYEAVRKQCTPQVLEA